LIGIGVAVTAMLPRWWPALVDEGALEAWVDELGWLGPLALVAVNALQIVVAPIPGYVVQIAAGFLYGPLWGGIWGSLGLMLGGTLAFGLARRFGRPPAERLIGRERLARWEHVTHSTSSVVWFLLLLGPTGDVPYYMAGLARVSLVKILVITLIVRVPSAFVAAAAGAGVMFLTWWQLALALALLTGLLAVFMRYHDVIIAWGDDQVQRRLDLFLRKGSG
jgi:uncharacterized membrane protein YdjX (TVP38/TMEM64 family)